MLAANIIVFIAVTLIVCTVDLSTITLDESSERLLYDQSEPDVQELEENAESVQTTVSEDGEIISDESMTSNAVDDIPMESESVVAAKSKDSEKEKSEFMAVKKKKKEEKNPVVSSADCDQLLKSMSKVNERTTKDVHCEDVGMSFGSEFAADEFDEFDDGPESYEAMMAKILEMTES